MSEEGPYKWAHPGQTSKREDPVKTLRDEFAMSALPAVISVCVADETHDLSFYDYCLREAYRFADAALAARKEK